MRTVGLVLLAIIALAMQATSLRPRAREIGFAPGVMEPGSLNAVTDVAGVCMIVVATDAPLDARDLKRLAARAIFALARTGSTYSNGSGDFAIAFTTNQSLRVSPASGAQTRALLTTDSVSPLFEAALDATEEAVYNSLLKAVDTTGNGQTVRAVPIDALKDLFAKYAR